MSFGNCGYALPTIIGAKAAAMDRPAIAYAGDGAWGMSMVEIMTCVRHDIPVTAVVFHNRQWGAEKKNQVDFYNRRFVAGELDNQSFAGIAKAMGAEGIVVDKLEDVGPALKRAIDAADERGQDHASSRSCAPASWATRSGATRCPSRCASSTSTRTTSERGPAGGRTAMSGHVLTLNAGSSSIKFALFDLGAADAETWRPDWSGVADGLGSERDATVRIRDGSGVTVHDAILGAQATHDGALAALLGWRAAQAGALRITAVGHRVVHGGTRLTGPVAVDDEAVAAIDGLASLAPLHQPHNVAGIRAARQAFADVPHVACFDTAFHADAARGQPALRDSPPAA